MSVMSYLGFRSAAIGVGVAGLLAGAVATAPDGLAVPARPGEAAAATTTLTFTRNSGDPTNSRLSVVRDGRTVAVFRAGSGLGASHPQGRDECARSKGWLPAGTYSVGARTTRYNGRVIKGYAIPLSDKTCKDGRTPRTELFIHSEMTRDGGQGQAEGQRWDGVKDYKSAGCVKLSPQDIKKLFGVLGQGSAPKRLTVR
ncbi:L,D-transpeptidase [Streptomyces sp. TRM76323]|uniref:L,D-transpeptidase n=1 Tax=Streptomyces tamarix TaxID=3078565 RepID=A0ABU3QVP8_9ACTN|nr:L,D-transpeptidase [Streptomyces tamarix]MDT9686651.1 L,D-transpeptidase [Streptomyces tamarix]